MLSEVAVQGFRCFDASQWHTLPLTQQTVIMGPNNSGKSALLSLIDFFRASCWQFPSFSYGFRSDIHEWGKPSDFLHRRDPAGGMAFRLGIAGRAKHRIHVNWSKGGWSQKLVNIAGEHVADVRDSIQSIWHLHPIRPELSVREHVRTSGTQYQPLAPNGHNAIQFLLERYTSRDPRWKEAEEWLQRIDPRMNLLMVPLRGETASVETRRLYGKEATADINIANQGTGIQSVCSVVAALVFSPAGSTVIIEEPEAYLHPRSQEVVVDLMNKAVNEWRKQVIATTHSWDIILPFISDIGEGRERGKQHVKADPKKFSLVMIDDDNNIEKYPLKGKPFMKVREDAKALWG